jgi:hypothetical protein
VVNEHRNLGPQQDDHSAKVLAKHRAMKWTPEKVHEEAKKHVMMTWGATDPMMDAVSRDTRHARHVLLR